MGAILEHGGEILDARVVVGLGALLDRLVPVLTEQTLKRRRGDTFGDRVRLGKRLLATVIDKSRIRHLSFSGRRR